MIDNTPVDCIKIGELREEKIKVDKEFQAERISKKHAFNRLTVLDAHIEKLQEHTLSSYITGNTPIRICLFSFTDKEIGQVELANVKFGSAPSTYSGIPYTGKSAYYKFSKSGWISDGQAIDEIIMNAEGLITGRLVVIEGLFVDKVCWAAGEWKDGVFRMTASKDMVLQDAGDGKMLATITGKYSLLERKCDDISEKFTCDENGLKILEHRSSYEAASKAFAKYAGTASFFAYGYKLVNWILGNELTWQQALDFGVETREQEIAFGITWGTWTNVCIDVFISK